MAQNYSTFDAGFNIVTPDFALLDTRYFKILQSLSELSSSNLDTFNSVLASRNIFGFGSEYRATDCTIVTSGSGNVLRFNSVISNYPVNSWVGAVIYDTGLGGLYYASSSKWVRLIDSDHDGVIRGNLSLSSSFPVYSLTGSNGGEIAITNTGATALFRISSSLTEATIHHTKNIIFKSGSNFIGEISTAGNLTFISGSVNFGNNSSNNTINGNLTVKGYLSASAISCSGDIIAFSTSDERLKDNITPLSDNLNKLDMINAYNFDWKPNAFRSGKDVGVLAQEIEKIMPEAVITRDTGYKAVDYQKLIGFLIGCVKELKQKLDEK